jgi:hypothetical protein
VQQYLEVRTWTVTECIQTDLTFFIFECCILFLLHVCDCLCGLVVRVLSYRSGGPGLIPGTTRFSEEKKKERQAVVGLERGPLGLVSTTEELLDRKVAALV